MAAANAITPQTLAALGAPALAAALIEHASSDPALRKKLRLLLVGTKGPDKLAAELGKRIQAIGRSRSLLIGDKGFALAQELNHIRTTIATNLAAQNQAVAIDRLWDFVAIADPVIDRVGDGSEGIEDVFADAMADLGRLIAADPDRDTAAIARRVLAMCEGHGFGSYAGTLQPFGEALGADGRALLRQATETALAALPPPKADDRWRDEAERQSLIQRLLTLADLEHDPDAYIAALRAGGLEDRYAPGIAQRLIDAGRPAEALQWLDKRRGRSEAADHADADLRIAAALALGRKDEAQALRWAVFERVLSRDHLRAFLNALPDFEDFDTEQKALGLAMAHQQAELALEFLVGWPALDRAAALVRDRVAALDGRAYEVLRPAAEALEEKYPAAATLLYRRLVESVLDRASSKQYVYAARDLASAARAAASVPPDATLESDATYRARLREQHGRKHGFWGLVD